MLEEEELEEVLEEEELEEEEVLEEEELEEEVLEEEEELQEVFEPGVPELLFNSCYLIGPWGGWVTTVLLPANQRPRQSCRWTPGVRVFGCGDVAVGDRGATPPGPRCV